MNETLSVLVVEDDADYALFLEHAFRKSPCASLAAICPHGEEAIEYLTGRGKYADRAAFPFPNVLFTDLRMPRMGGFELLEWLRAHPEFSMLPTVVLTSSADPKDVTHAYQLGTNAYIVKPDKIETLEHLLQSTCAFWAQCAEPVIPTP